MLNAGTSRYHARSDDILCPLLRILGRNVPKFACKIKTEKCMFTVVRNKNPQPLRLQLVRCFMKLFIFTFLFCLAVSPPLCPADEIYSPDRRILLHTHAESGEVAYSVEFDGQPIIGRSRLGVRLKGGAFADKLRAPGSKTHSHDEKWNPV